MCRIKSFRFKSLSGLVHLLVCIGGGRRNTHLCTPRRTSSWNGDAHLDKRSAHVFFSPGTCTILNLNGLTFNVHRNLLDLPVLVVAADGLFIEKMDTKFLWSVYTRLSCFPALIQCWYRGNCSPIKYASLSMMAHRNCDPLNFPDKKASGL